MALESAPSQSPNTNKPKYPIFIGGRLIGFVDEAGEFRKVIRGSKHMLRRPRAIGYDVAILREAAQNGAARLYVLDYATNIEYRATMADIDEHGFDVVCGHNPQRALALDRWSIDGQPPAAAARAAATNQERIDLQAGLFGGTEL